MLGAVVGGCLFWLLGIDFGLADLKVTFEDLLSAFVSSLLCIVAWRLIRKRAGQKNSGVGRDLRRQQPYAVSGVRRLGSRRCSSQ
jgi:hypothetical protein